MTEVPTAPTPDQLVVHAVLDPSRREQYVRVELASTGQRPSWQAGCVKDAAVVITTPEGVAMRARSDSVANDPYRSCGRYRLSLDDHGVTLAPGASYALRVQVPGIAEVTGTTTIPDASPVNAVPAPEPFSMGRDTLHVEYLPAAGAAAHELRIASGFAVYNRFIDGATAVPGTLRDIGGGAVFHPSIPEFTQPAAMVTVAAVDRNYYDYYRAVTDPITGGAMTSRLGGGAGVFGSIVIVKRRSLDVRR